MTNYIIITGGAGFIGTNLIKLLLKKTKYKIISIDNYSTGLKDNHVLDKRVKYLKGHTKNISILLSRYKKNIQSIFHFGEFARIYQSFLKLDDCIDSNSIGTHEVIRFGMINKVKLIYSATSASLGNNGDDKNISPYAFTKSKNLEILENFRKWFNFKFEIIYFYNVYGPNHISKGDMATVIGIFEDAYLKGKSIPVVLPGTQTRRFTHVSDTVNACYLAWKANKQRHYSISSKQSLSIIQIAKLFGKKIAFMPKRKGERYASALANMNLTNRVYQIYGKIKITDYIQSFVKKNNSNKN
jgi:UDP-glucose 4-epimerase